MVKNFASKRRARAYQSNNPGTTFPEAKRATSSRTSPPLPTADRVPWLRERPRHTKVGCYFCGKETAILSMNDHAADAGRIQIYCDNGECEARTIEVIVVGDDDPATARRADVSVLADFPAAYYHQPPRNPGEYEDWMPGSPPNARRDQAASLRCLFCGELSCVLADGDVPADTGRVQIRCGNGNCVVRTIEVLVDRDGTEATRERPDMQALREIDTPPQLRSTSPFASWTFAELREAHKNDNLLERRIGRQPH